MANEQRSRNKLANRSNEFVARAEAKVPRAQSYLRRRRSTLIGTPLAGETLAKFVGCSFLRLAGTSGLGDER